MTKPLDAVDAILWKEAASEVCDLLDLLETGDLAGLELAGLLVILRGAKERLDGEPTGAPVIKMVG